MLASNDYMYRKWIRAFSNFHGLHSLSDLFLTSRDPRKSRREEIDKEQRKKGVYWSVEET